MLYRDELGSKEFIQELRLLKNGFHHVLREEPRKLEFDRSVYPRIINVYLSHGCNLACRYCTNQQGSFGGPVSFMSVETAQCVVNFISRIVLSEQHDFISVNLFGGEPLLNPEATLTIASGLQNLNHIKLKTKVHLILSTNGTIYNKKIFDIFAEYPQFSSVLISLDGSKTVHDLNRPFPDGTTGSYDTVVENLKEIIRTAVPYSVTCVVSSPHDYISAAEELHKIGLKRVEIKPRLDHVHGAGALPDAVDSEFELWRRNYLAYTEYYLNHLDTPSPVMHVDRYSLMGEYINLIGTSNDPPTTLACGVVAVKIGITADGTIVPCEFLQGDEKFKLGDVGRGFDDKKFYEFEQWIFKKGQHRTDVEKCRNCFAKRVCACGCYAVSFDKSGQLVPCEDSMCRVIKERTKIDLYFISELKKRHPKFFARFTGTPVT